MTIFQTILYGIIQGVTEFLPISSSAHLVLLPWFTGWTDPGLAFDVALHWGTLLGVVIYFWRDIAQLIKEFLSSFSNGEAIKKSLSWKIIAATVPGALFGYVFEKQAETTFRSPLLIAFTLSLLGLLLWFADRYGKQGTDVDSIGWGKALLIGVSQGFAIIPGVSRSGITISVGLLLGLQKPATVRFSFLLSMPIILGAGILKIDHLFTNAGDLTLWIGMGVSAVSGFAAIHFLINHVKVKSFLPFVIYRWVLAGLILLKIGIG